MAEEEKSSKEKRIRAITNLYYSNPKVQEALINFASYREVVPRYFEGFGKRPDMLQYVSDITGLAEKGATSFHSSEELWNDVLQLSSEITKEKMDELRKSWDLLIDIDSPYLDCSKIAARLIVAALEHHGIKKYGIKFSGSKGFHIIVSSKAFPREYKGNDTKKMFPEWPRAISEYLMNYIKKDYNKQASEILTNFDAIEKRTNVSKEELQGTYCMQCGKAALKGALIKLKCPVCGLKMERRDPKITKRRLRCINNGCAGVLEIEDEDEYFFCENCKDPKNEKMALSSDRYPEMFEKVQGVSAEKVAALDLVLVAPRHLFRMPYSLHEKTSLASVVLKKDDIDSFSPRDADPMKVKIINFLPDNEDGEAKKLLAAALDWKMNEQARDEKITNEKYHKYSNREFEKIDISNVTEEIFPQPIKKLLKGLKDGKKRGLFILITFLRSINYSAEQINSRIREWNKLNEPPLREGYVKSQIDWHLRQKRKILPPNYDNPAFYKDLGLLDKKQEAKNPISEIAREIRKRR